MLETLQETSCLFDLKKHGSSIVFLYTGVSWNGDEWGTYPKMDSFNSFIMENPWKCMIWEKTVETHILGNLHIVLPIRTSEWLPFPRMHGIWRPALDGSPPSTTYRISVDGNQQYTRPAHRSFLKGTISRFPKSWGYTPSHHLFIDWAFHYYPFSYGSTLFYRMVPPSYKLIHKPH